MEKTKEKIQNMKNEKQTLVLLAEEDSHLADIYTKFLKKEGIKVVVERNGEMVAEVTKKRKPDLVILEAILPNIDGFSVLEKLKTNKSTKSIPVILFTSVGQKEDVERALDLGAEEYLLKAHTKPVDLVRKIKNILKI
ncbi:MAG: response regulator [Candidatus Magasanikbacteria bacterium CG_4_9_14_3_um_filter_32_9]|uniref:Response regulator n=1 Tax=Candidatus Magasanikbacteria bacterium CG_4_9_14_3_um_filter_32_9 TaxID=1974644 RepID=A0A2M7Z6U0_9BACT|nr:MAG: response regulator [Candidatus Magasanikbacteria bacterium CG_4_9_14_3_um_filter_32_9]